MYKNSLKEKLKNNKRIKGCIIQAALPALVEICGLCKFDFVFIDAEHGPLSTGDCENLVRAAEVSDIIPIIRVPQNIPEVILSYMDIGGMGIIAPDISCKEDAEAAVRAVKYHPYGERGLSATRSSKYGLGEPISEYIVEANNETVVLAVIESQKAIENIAEILSVEGIDGVLIGTSDLSQSLGVAGQTNHAKVLEAFDKALNLGLKIGKPIGAVVRAGEKPEKYFDMGVNIVLISAYSLFASASKMFIKSCQK